MLEALANIYAAIILPFTGYYAVKRIIDSQEKLNIKKIPAILIISAVSIVLLKIKTTGMYTIAVILIDIIVYKYVFNISIEDSLVATCTFIASMFVTDIIVAQVFCIFISVQEMKINPIMIIAANTAVCSLIILLFSIKPFLKHFRKFYNSSKKVVTLKNIIFLILLVIGFSLLAYNVTASNSWSSDYIINTIVMLIYGVITFIYIQNRNKFNQLTDEYDSLFSYIQNFEEWIEREQFNRHEYKNQLAVLRYLSKEKKVKEKIDEILQDNINLEGDVINKLKNLPKGGIKGLMYYKVIIAQKQGIKLTIDVSLKENSKLERLNEKQVRVVCQLIGVYFDNAIEAAAKTRKKQVTIEIYELNDKVNLIISNTFKKSKNFDKRNEKGISSKGKGRGNGLYFAKKTLSKNKWLSEEQEIIDNYYVQKLFIDTSKDNK